MERKAERAVIPAYGWVVCFQVLQKKKSHIDFGEDELDGKEI